MFRSIGKLPKRGALLVAAGVGVLAWRVHHPLRAPALVEQPRLAADSLTRISSNPCFGCVMQRIEGSWAGRPGRTPETLVAAAAA